MNAVTKTEGAALSVTMGFNDLASFEFMQRTAKMFSASTMVPTAYQAMVTKGAKVIVYPGAPHGITDTHKDRLNQDLLAFLRE